MTTKTYNEAINIFNDCIKNMINKTYIYNTDKSEFLCRQIHLFYTEEGDYVICVSNSKPMILKPNPNIGYIGNPVFTFNFIMLNNFLNDYTLIGEND